MIGYSLFYSSRVDRKLLRKTFIAKLLTVSVFAMNSLSIMVLVLSSVFFAECPYYSLIYLVMERPTSRR